MENWKDIKNYEGLYQVSNKGNIRNTRTNKILKHTMNNRGYEQVTLSKNGKKKTIRVYTLVTDAFKLNPDNKEIVTYIDGNRTNNDIRNLKWVNPDEDQVPVKKTLKDRIKRLFKCIILLFYY